MNEKSIESDLTKNIKDLFHSLVKNENNFQNLTKKRKKTRKTKNKFAYSLISTCPFARI